MLTVVAPAAMTRSTTSAKKSSSVRAASSGENSMSSREAAGALDAGHRPAQDLVLRHVQLELAVNGAGRQEDVDALARRGPPGRRRRGRCRPRDSGPGRR